MMYVGSVVLIGWLMHNLYSSRSSHSLSPALSRHHFLSLLGRSAKLESCLDNTEQTKTILKLIVIHVIRARIWSIENILVLEIGK